MCILIFPSKIWAKKHTLYTATYGKYLLHSFLSRLLREPRRQAAYQSGPGPRGLGA